jgi:hypothetical protein
MDLQKVLFKMIWWLELLRTSDGRMRKHAEGFQNIRASRSAVLLDLNNGSGLGGSLANFHDLLARFAFKIDFTTVLTNMGRHVANDNHRDSAL